MNNFASWIYHNLFSEDAFESKFFPHEIVLYSYQPLGSFDEHLRSMLLQGFKHEHFYSAVMKACGEHHLRRDATWFQVNVIDYAAWDLTAYGRYHYPRADGFIPLFSRMEAHPTEQGGPNYIGLVGVDKNWLGLMQMEGDYKSSSFQIRVCGSQPFCNAVTSHLNNLSTQ